MTRPRFPARPLPARVAVLCSPTGQTVIKMHHQDGSEDYLTYYDPEFQDGVGLCQGGSRADALRFVNPGAALECWRLISTTRPLRPDGKPNRPLSALTVSLEPASGS